MMDEILISLIYKAEYPNPIDTSIIFMYSRFSTYAKTANDSVNVHIIHLRLDNLSLTNYMLLHYSQKLLFTTITKKKNLIPL